MFAMEAQGHVGEGDLVRKTHEMCEDACNFKLNSGTVISTNNGGYQYTPPLEPMSEANDRGQSFAMNMISFEDIGSHTQILKSPEETANLLYDKSIYAEANVTLDVETPQIITSSRPPYRVIDVNDKWLTFCGYNRDDIMGQTLNLLQGPRTNYEDLKPMMAAVKEQRAGEAQVLNYTKCGTEFLNEITIEPMEVAPGKCDYLHSKTKAPFVIASTRRWTKTSDKYNRKIRDTWQAKADEGESYEFAPGAIQITGSASFLGHKLNKFRNQRRKATLASTLSKAELDNLSSVIVRGNMILDGDVVAPRQELYESDDSSVAMEELYESDDSSVAREELLDSIDTGISR